MTSAKLLFPFSFNDTTSNRVVEYHNEFSYVSNGVDILDLSLGNAGCFLLGFKRTDIIDYVSANMIRAPFVSGEFMSSTSAVLALAEKLYQLSCGYKSVFSLSGSDSLEGAIKLAFMSNPNKNKIIGFKNSYHGSTFLTSSIGNIDYMTRHQGKHVDCCVVDSYDLDKIKSALPNACCLIIESCSWNNGLVELSDSFWINLRKLCTLHNVILIVDDIAMSGGKTGSMFGFNKHAKPDIFCVGKSFSGGYYPLSACLVNESIYAHAKDKLFPHGFTYSFSLSGIYGTLKYIEILEKEKHFEEFDNKIAKAKDHLDRLINNDVIISYRNYGLVFSLKINPTHESVLYNNGINIGLWNNTEDTLLLIIPLTANDEYYETLTSRLSSALLRP